MYVLNIIFKHCFQCLDEWCHNRSNIALRFDNSLWEIAISLKAPLLLAITINYLVTTAKYLIPEQAFLKKTHFKPTLWQLVTYFEPFLNGNFFQPYSLLRSFLTKTNGFLTRWKITWVDRHIPTIIFVYGNTFWTISVLLRH